MSFANVLWFVAAVLLLAGVAAHVLPLVIFALAAAVVGMFCEGADR